MSDSTRKVRPTQPSAVRPIRSRQYQQQPGIYVAHPAAGAHAAAHLINEDATPGAGCLPSCDHSGREVDSGAG